MRWIVIIFIGDILQAQPELRQNKVGEESCTSTQVDQPKSMNTILLQRLTVSFLLCVHCCMQQETNASQRVKVSSLPCCT